MLVICASKIGTVQEKDQDEYEDGLVEVFSRGEKTLEDEEGTAASIKEEFGNYLEIMQ